MGATISAGEPRHAALIGRAQGGDRDAFGILIREHDEAMRRLAYSLLQDRGQMDDALQEAYFRAYRGLGSFRGAAAFSTWLYRIVYRTCIDEIRKRRPVDPLDDGRDVADPASGPESQVAARRDVAAALARLSSDMRAAVWLIDAEGLSYDEAARVLGTPPGTVASRVSRARAHLREHLHDPGHPEEEARHERS